MGHREIKEEIKQPLELNDNASITYWIKGHNESSPRKEDESYECPHCKTKWGHINDLMVHLKFPEKQEQSKPKAGTRKEIIKIRDEISDTETKKCKEWMNKSLFFKRINKWGKALVNLIKQRGDKTQINAIRKRWHHNGHCQDEKDD